MLLYCLIFVIVMFLSDLIAQVNINNAASEEYDHKNNLCKDMNYNKTHFIFANI